MKQPLFKSCSSLIWVVIRSFLMISLCSPNTLKIHLLSSTPWPNSLSAAFFWFLSLLRVLRFSKCTFLAEDLDTGLKGPKPNSELLLLQVRGSKFCVGQHVPHLQRTDDQGGLELLILSDFLQIKLNQYVSPLWAFASLSSSVLLGTLPTAPSVTWEKLPGRSRHPLFLGVPAQNWSLWHNY